FLPSVGHDARLRTQSPTRRARMRLGLLVLAAVALALWLNQFRNPGWDLPEPARTPAAAPAFDPALQPIAVDADAIHRIPTPPALAATLAAMELATVPAATLCLPLDGEEPDPAPGCAWQSTITAPTARARAPSPWPPPVPTPPPRSGGWTSAATGMNGRWRTAAERSRSGARPVTSASQRREPPCLPTPSTC